MESHFWQGGRMSYPKFILDRTTERHQEHFTVKQVAKMLNRHPKTVYRWIDEGFLQNIIRVRDGYLIPKKEIERVQVIINPQI
jgi:excisionase family DNA binding protein